MRLAVAFEGYLFFILACFQPFDGIQIGLIEHVYLELVKD